jgi:hypothetical protein
MGLRASHSRLIGIDLIASASWWCRGNTKPVSGKNSLEGTVESAPR